MYLLQIQFSVSDIIILIIMAVVLGCVIHFVLVNRRKLQAMIEESKKQGSLTGSGGRYLDEIPKPAWVEKKRFSFADVAMPFTATRRDKAYAPVVAAGPGVVQDLKQHIRQQQRTLDQLLMRVDKLDVPDVQLPSKSTAAAYVLEEKEVELQKTKLQLSASQKIASRVTEVYQEFDQLQQKLTELEERAGKAAELAMELDDVQQAYAQLKKDCNRKQEKLHEAVEEAALLHGRLAETEDKLTEANLQRQQLQKKAQVLENLNNELQQMSEANKKMKAELRRIAELESMLSLVSDERDLLLKKRLS